MKDLGKRADLFDSHAHLTFKDFEVDLEEVLERAAEAGVVGIITIGSGGGPEVHKKARALARPTGRRTSPPDHRDRRTTVAAADLVA